MQNEATAAQAPPYKVSEIAAMLNIHPRTVLRAIHDGDLRAIRVGRGRGGFRVPRAAYRAYLAARTTGATREVTP